MYNDWEVFEVLKPTFLKRYFNIFFTIKINQIHICIKKMPGVGSIAMISVWTSILSSQKNGNGAPRRTPFIKFLLLILGKQFLNQNDVEFDFRLGHALILFAFLWIIK